MRKPNKIYHTEAWDAEQVRALRLYLNLTQQEFSEHLGIRQQTVSEWETGLHSPRGASRTLLKVIAENRGFTYNSELQD